MNDNQRSVPNSNGGVNMMMGQPVPPENQQAQILNQVNGAIPNQGVEQPTNQVMASGGVMNQVEDTPINNMNVDGTYNKMNVAPEYVNDQQVKENIEMATKKTVPVSKELKTVILIAMILLLFIIVMPYLFDLISNIRYH